MIIAAPMAGGPSTPHLVNAVAQAGGCGFLAGGYLSGQELLAQMDGVTCGKFGINLFAPQKPPAERDRQHVLDWAESLRPIAQRLGVDDFDPAAIYNRVDPTDRFREKLEAIIDRARNLNDSAGGSR